MNPLPDQRMLELAAKSMFDAFAGTAMGSLLVDRQHRIVWISESYKQFLPGLGFASAEAFVGKRVEEVVPNTLMNQVIDSGKPEIHQQLKKYYTFYTGGFISFVILVGILEQMGVPNKILGYMFLFPTIALYAGIGFMSKTSDVGEYYVAGRRVPALFNGMATGADWMSAASFIGTEWHHEHTTVRV